jgi:hypothetical protein
VAGGVRLIRNAGGTAQVEVDLDHDVTILVDLVDVSGAGAWRVAAVTDASAGAV